MDKIKNYNPVKNLYVGSMILAGSVAGIWSFTANRFRVSECIVIIIVGIIAGVGLGMILYAITTLLKK